MATKSTWVPSEQDPRVHVRLIENVGYAVRYELPIPATRVRCGTCRKDLVPNKTGEPRAHKCEPDLERGYRLIKRRGKLKLFGTPTKAIAVARDIAGFSDRPIQSNLLEFSCTGAEVVAD